MKVLIVEDEKLSRERLAEMLLQHDPQIQIMAALDSVSATVDFLKQQEAPDLIFLDIQLADGLSFEIFQHVSTNKPVIFTTAYDQYALKAFEVNSLDYLIKPLSPEKLTLALNKYRDLKGQSSTAIDPGLIQKLIDQSKTYKERFLVKLGRKLFYKKAQEVGFFYADGKVVYLTELQGKGRYIIDHTLDELSENLLDPTLFFRINRTYIVQINAIEEIQPYANQRLLIKLKGISGHDFIVSREKTPLFKSWLNY